MNYDKYKTYIIESDIFDATQKILYDVARKHDDLCTELNTDLSNLTSATVQSDIFSSKQDIDILKVDIENIKKWIDNIVKINKHLLSLYDMSTYSYMSEPYKDDFGTVHDNVTFPRETNLSYNSNYKTTPDDTLLTIDKQGNVWINGVMENNSVKIGDSIKRLAEEYKNNIPMQSVDDFNF